MSQKDDAFLKRVRDKFQKAEERESNNRKRAEEAIRFRALEQWPETVKRDREDVNRIDGPQPCPVLDKTNQYIRQVINEERINPPSIKVRPVDDEADIKVAEVYNGIIRHIQDASDASVAYTTAGEHAIDGGFGYWRILTEYCDPMSFDQDIVIKRIPNRFSVILGPHMEQDGSDMKYAFVFENIPKDDFEAKFPKFVPSDFNQASKDADGWFNADTVRVAEYMEVTENKVDIVLLDSGDVLEKDVYLQNLQAAQTAIAQGQQDVPIPQVVKERSTTKKVVTWYKLTGTDIIDQKQLVGSYIPIVKVVGNELWMPDGSLRTSGMVETMMDPQRLHNYAHAGFITHVALAPKAPFVGAVGQFSTEANAWATANRYNYSRLEYDPIDVNGAPLPPPQRSPAPGIPSGWQQMLLNTEHGIEGASGMYGASIGGPSRERSGVALEGQQQQGQTGNFHYPDNLSRAIKHTGRILLEWIPKYYDTKRVARIIGEDGAPCQVVIDPDQDEATKSYVDQTSGKEVTSYNLNVGTYDVTISVGPSFQTKRQEGSQMMQDAMNKNPTLVPLIGDLFFRSIDYPYADKIADRLKAMLPPPIQQMEQQGEQKPVDPQVAATMQRMDQAGQMLAQKQHELTQMASSVQQAQRELDAGKTELNAKLKELQVEQKNIDADRRELMATFKELKAELELERAKFTQEQLPKIQSVPFHTGSSPIDSGTSTV